MTDLAAEVLEVLETDPAEFTRRARAEVERIIAEIDDGTFDNPQGALGLEYEFYAVAEPSAPGYSERPSAPFALSRVPRHLLEYVGFEKELGLHNAEMSTQPEPFNEYGLVAQESSVRARLAAAQDPARTAGLRLVSDGLWTIPPSDSSAREYLSQSRTHEGLLLATNMSDAPRYHAIANTETTEMALQVSLPHATIRMDTIMPVALTTSIQPHYQVPRARSLPEYFRYALRIAGPVLAMGVNAPLLPPDLYDPGVDPRDVLSDGWAEHRIPIFEGTLNPPASDGSGRVGDPDAAGDAVHEDHRGKVRFPRDLETVRTAVERIATDQTVVPMPVPSEDRFDNEFAHFRLKHGTYWRWVRPVFDGETRSAANARIEFRPLAGQPTVRDSIAFQAAFGGALEGLHAVDHPIRQLGWQEARRNFYRAARDGLDAELVWIDAAGERTTDRSHIFEDLLNHAERGLEAQGFSAGAIQDYFGPIRTRIASDVTPADWKRRRMRAALDDGEDLAEAIWSAQRAYIRRQQDTLLTGSFEDWLGEP